MSGHESLPRIETTDERGFGPEDQALFDRIADRIARRRLTVPAVFFLESSKPLSFVGSQALVFFEPFLRSVVSVPAYERFVALMEERENVERLIQSIERRDGELVQEDKAARSRERERKRTAQAEAARARASSAEKQPTPRQPLRSKWRTWFSGRS